MHKRPSCQIFCSIPVYKNADDTSLLLSSDSGNDLVDELYNTKQWAAQNYMVINLQNKIKELVFRQPNPRLVVLPVRLDQMVSAQLSEGSLA